MTIEWNGMTPMTPHQWHMMKDNPVQRNTAEHANFAVKRHLSGYHDMHKYVNAAVLPNGDTYKIDGHTRGLLWSDGRLTAPDSVYVTWWRCETIKDVESIYRTFDSRKAAESARDEVYGVFRKHGLEFQSQLLRKRQFLSALKSAWAVCFGGRMTTDADDLERAISEFAEELEMFDQLRPTNKTFFHATAAACLVTLKRDGVNALPFWRMYSRDEGWKGGGEVDPVEALSRLVTQMRKDRAYGDKNMQDLMQRALSCYEAWRSNQTYHLHSQGGVGVKKTTSFKSFRQRRLRSVA